MSSILKKLSGETSSTATTSAPKEEKIVESIFSQKKTSDIQETIIGHDAKFNGVLKFDRKMLIDGKVEGTIESNGSLIIGKGAEVKAEIKAGNAVIAGHVYGNITAIEKVELQSTAKLFGDIQASRLIVADGVTFVGKSDVDPSRTGRTAAAPQGKAVEEKDLGKSKELQKGIFSPQKDEASKKTLV